eukprot:CAMPEP_0117023476 /NCGR_PEP_ID=MMETSP0472-20121206/17520_1 /TAXON_ID=693140 ORGANISM="Tiarina fusus, Strain LIS" /NCGR_SAMPLE_ID=MMETSP0472 /ASSEMBLY_ACC=CAM_ASM_000603 /LENGTH=473 /DNA_ID=CAMNT_0004729611 /DNA_START=44 /DNA_END=1465 /DNA_ORIENTATION=+
MDSKAMPNSVASQIDSFSAELSRLSIEERSNALYDLHGVSDKQPETAEMIESHTEQMRSILSTISSQGGEDSLAYRKAKSANANYVDGLKLRFLRADGYNSREAAFRMLRFFERKSYLFGEDKLGREIELHDLSEEEVQALKEGLVQISPVRDQAGRAIIFFHGQVHEKYECTKSVMRVIFYFMMATLRDSESQTNGTVMVSYGLGQQRTIPGRMSEFLKIWESIPWRFVACHYCKERRQFGILQPVVQVLAKSLQSKILSRFRIHTGSHIEIMFNLMTFGIPKDAIPVDDNGSMAGLSQHHKVLESLGYVTDDSNDPVAPIVASSDSSLAPLSPKSNAGSEDAVSLVLGSVDVLMGRGHHPKSSPGSLRLYNMLLEYNDKYNAADKAEKTVISRQILKRMKDMGSRFMARSEGGFVECDDSVARKKIAHGFRNLRLKLKGDSTTSSQTRRGNKRILAEESKSEPPAYKIHAV